MSTQSEEFVSIKREEALAVSLAIDVFDPDKNSSWMDVLTEDRVRHLVKVLRTAVALFLEEHNMDIGLLMDREIAFENALRSLTKMKGDSNGKVL